MNIKTSYYNKDIARVIINEYVNLAHAFFDDQQPNLANGVIDGLARKIREKEFVGLEAFGVGSHVQYPPIRSAASGIGTLRKIYHKKLAYLKMYQFIVVPMTQA